MDVLFGDKDHFCREAIWFEVVDLESPYHALLGRPALAKFMAVPHYAYLKMKMPSSKRIITMAGRVRRDCRRKKDAGPSRGHGRQAAGPVP